MEKAHFVKCEPWWSSDTEESCNWEKHVQLSADHLKIKTEPYHASPEPSAAVVESEPDIEVPHPRSPTAGDKLAVVKFEPYPVFINENEEAGGSIVKEECEVEVPLDHQLIMENSGRRSKNFNHIEIDLLLSLVSAKRNILECKKTDSVSLKDKEMAWKELADSFNEISGNVVRDWKVLKGKYENLKKASKKKFAEEKRYTSGTGGGPYKPNLITATDIKIKEIIGKVQIEGLPSVCDSDSIGQPSLLSSTEDPSVNIEEVQFQPNQNSHESSFLSLHLSQSEASQCQALVTTDDSHSTDKVIESIPVVTQHNMQVDEIEAVPCSSQFSIRDLRRPTSAPLRVKKKRPLLDSTLAGKKLMVLSDEKTEVLQLQRQAIEDQVKFQKVEHEQKMKQMKEEHTAKMSLLELDIENKKFDLKMKQTILELDVRNRELDIEIKTKQIT